MAIMRLRTVAFVFLQILLLSAKNSLCGDNSGIMRGLQNGIQKIVLGYYNKPVRDLIIDDFSDISVATFTDDHVDVLSGEIYINKYTFTSYAPVAFRYLWDLYNFKSMDYLNSFTNAPLKEFSNPAQSGSLFIVTHDEQFFMKTVKRSEERLLLKLLPQFYMSFTQHSRTLLPKFSGFYQYQRKFLSIRLVTMNNILPTTIKMDYKYDLKGSTYNRKASAAERGKEIPTYKDIDFKEKFPSGIFLEADVYDSLIDTISRDTMVLESLDIQDYSLLLGIHYLENAEIACLKSSDATENHNDEVKGSVQLPHCTPHGILAKTAQGDNLMLYIGIIDILSQWRFKRKLEYAAEAIFTDGKTVDAANPEFYAKRFKEFLADEVFKKHPTPMVVIACENKDLNISCEKQLINIIDASYGRSDKKTCNNFFMFNSVLDCSAPGSKDIVKERCQNKNECTLKASNSVFGIDPCPITQKYLSVKYSCI